MKMSFERELKEKLVSIEQNIDPQMHRKLSAARKDIVVGSKSNFGGRLRKLLWPAVGMALASSLVFVVVLMPLRQAPGFDSFVVDDPGSESFEILEDLDFYYWLAENESNMRG
jgi:hypothetical protein